MADVLRDALREIAELEGTQGGPGKIAADALAAAPGWQDELAGLLHEGRRALAQVMAEFAPDDAALTLRFDAGDAEVIRSWLNATGDTTNERSRVLRGALLRGGRTRG